VLELVPATKLQGPLLLDEALLTAGWIAK